jgi:transcriptional regulator of acetoin/glycerol metabolism
MSEASEIELDDLQLPDARARAPGPITGVRATKEASQPRVGSMAEFKDSERERILQALTACNWNRVQAAKMIGVPRRTFYRRLREYGIL